MIPSIRSLSELMAITEARVIQKNLRAENDFNNTKVNKKQQNQHPESLYKKDIDLPALPKSIRRKWIQKKEIISRFIDDLDYNNQIQSSYDLTLLERQSQKRKQDVA